MTNIFETTSFGATSTTNDVLSLGQLLLTTGLRFLPGMRFIALATDTTPIRSANPTLISSADIRDTPPSLKSSNLVPLHV